MSKKPRVVVVGSANIDLTTFTAKFPRPGETIFGDRFDLGFGGKGANQAVAASYCGAKAHMIARVGDGSGHGTGAPAPAIRRGQRFRGRGPAPVGSMRTEGRPQAALASSSSRPVIGSPVRGVPG